VIALLAGAIGFVGTLAALDSRDSGSAVASDTTALNELTMQQSDVPVGYGVLLIPNGTDAVNHPTLDLCNGTFPSEALRSARRQVIVTTVQGDTGISTEAVLYRNPDSAARAFSDLRSVVAKCPNKPVASPVGEATVTTKFHARPDTAWPKVPNVERLAYDLTATDTQGNSQRTVAVYLRNGGALLGIYFPSTGTQVAVAGKTKIPDIVNVFEQRMAQLPADVVNAKRG
jgi:hypothetical protein